MELQTFAVPHTVQIDESYMQLQSIDFIFSNRTSIQS